MTSNSRRDSTPIKVNWLHDNFDKKKAANDKYIALLQAGLYTANTIIRFHLDHNQSIDSPLEYPSLSYILDNHRAELIHDKIQRTDTAIVVWLGGFILEQETLKAIE